MFKTQPNFRFHIVVALLVVAAGFYFQVTSIEWLVLMFSIGLVLVAELFNTAIEATIDLITAEHRVEARVAKDTAAGGVLVTSAFASVCGLYIFVPYLKTLFI